MTKRERKALQIKRYKRIGVAISLIIIFVLLIEKRVVYPSGVMAKGEPVQSLFQKPYRYKIGELDIEAVGSFSVHGKILSKTRYRFADDSDYIPYDFAMGWGEMSDQKSVDRVDVWQKDRWYYFQAVEKEDISLQMRARSLSANMHLFPTSDVMFQSMGEAKEGDIIKFTGRLVNFKTPDGKRFKTSTTRTDSGGGACEIIVIDSFEIVNDEKKKIGVTLPFFRTKTIFLPGMNE